ncbi:MAG TPA: aminoglycoside phosphotransferase family protein [Candidatus Bathyarchaeia archaeon]|jgi:aminoglycoside phosphotransferase (APT) family kinase protein|nr:aminoglycoside phosphotransferase family protein [Candidatus Bathyarchaeia archaeon]
MLEHILLKEEPPDVQAHPATRAWNRFHSNLNQATGITLLKKCSKSAIYKVDGVGPGSSAVVAKLCHHQVAAHERIVYEQILPALPISYPCCHGSIQENAQQDWLFLEYVDGEPYSRFRDDHSILVAKWLGLLHSASTQIADVVQLPDRGPRYHLTHLREARGKLRVAFDQLKLPAEELEVIEAVISQCGFLESRWGCVEQWCAGMPRTFIHGDLKPRNVAIRSGLEGPEVLVFDWEASGWGVPTGDLAYVDLTAYHDAVKHRWPNVTVEEVRKMKITGRIFRGIEEFRWESERFDPRWEVSTIKLNYYRERMAEAIQMAQW